MELFSITCTTCKSRLKVRDQAAVGQILACPKCGGMVMIKPPPVWTEAADQKSDLPTVTELVGNAAPFDQTLDSSAFDVVEELLSDSPPKVQPPPSFTPSPEPAAPAAAKPRFVGGPPAHRSPPPSTSAPLKPDSPPKSPARHDTDPLPPPPPAETAEAVHPQADAASARRYWIFMAGSVALGIVLAFAAVTAAIKFLGPVDRKATRTASVATMPGASQDGDVAAASSAVPADSTPIAAAVEAAVAPSPSANASSLPPEPSATSTSADPPGLVKDAPGAATAPLTTSDPLARFDRLIGGAGDDPLAKPTPGASKSAPTAPTDPAPTRPVVPRPPPREIDVARRLADPLPGIETPGTPLADFVQLMMDLSTIPITLELPFAPATAESPIVLRLTNSTVEKALAEALKPMRLECVVVDDQLVVRRAEPNPVAPFSQNVKDLTGGDEQQMTELAELLMAIVDPAAWGEGEGSGSIGVDEAKGMLIISHRRAVQLQVLIALDKLRASRTPPLGPVLKFDPSLFAWDSRSTLAKSRLEKPISLNFGQPTRLVTILDRLGQAAGVRILVDWHDVASGGWNPAAEASLVVSNQPLAGALDSLLDPLDLTWRIIDGQTIQVVTPERFAEQGELEFFKVADLATDHPSGEALVARVRAALGESSMSGGNGEIRYWAEGKCLLAWLPQPKQRELEGLLAKWRSEKAK